MGRGRLAASHGIQQAISTPAPPKTVADLPPVYHKLNWQQHLMVMHEMGQDGTEGEGYVSTSRSWFVNTYLRTDGDLSEAFESGAGWNLSEAEVHEIINRLDSQMRPMSRNIQGVRFVGAEMLKDLGLPAKATPEIAAKLQKMVQSGKMPDYVSKAYTSFSTDANANVFTEKPIRINYKIGTGAPCIMTKNVTESEGVLGRGVKQRVTGARWVQDAFGGKLEIDITV